MNKKKEKIEKAKKDLADHIQCQFICSDGGGGIVATHYMGCPYYLGFHQMQNQIKQKYKL